MYLKSLEVSGFKSFGKKSSLEFATPVTAIVGPNGSGKSNIAESFRFVLGEQSIKNMRGKRGEDLIWGGSADLPRSNRASVKVVFDNTKRLLNVDFDEVVLERVVFRDGVNEYLVNGSKVRLKDVTELLAGANIGSSGHHIISQGEADRVLSATPRERRNMIEDALGLRIYQYKKDESVKKLEKTEENRVQVELLRKENIPHLKFLERQVKKIEKAHELRAELVVAYREYLKREEEYLSYEKEVLQGERAEPARKLREIQDTIVDIRTKIQKAHSELPEHHVLRETQTLLHTLRQEMQEHVRAVGRLEGQVTYEERRIEHEMRRVAEEEGHPVPYRSAKSFWDELTTILDKAHTTNGDRVDVLKHALFEAQKCLREFVERFRAEEREEYVPDKKELERLLHEKELAEQSITLIETRIGELEAKSQELLRVIDESKESDRELERELYSYIQQETELRAELSRMDMRTETLAREEEEFKRELREAVALIGRQASEYREYVPSEPLSLDSEHGEARQVQYERRRSLEKMKIRLEEMGGANVEEVMREYKDIQERDAFLERELTDLSASAQSLRNLITDLEREISEKFEAGVKEIDTQFSAFFTLMFGGGSASLVISGGKKKQQKGLLQAMMEEFGAGGASEESAEETEQGIDIEVSLPKKRIQSLMMLSGGERTLTSIALIFAMSQVNPPPFIILDETDAALDEANSRRYGDMIVQLSLKSQLILITHNRETMSRAGVLYGITMGLNGVSKILSVKFDEAVAVAK
jgi:chromosome segregation ATPase